MTSVCSSERGRLHRSKDLHSLLFAVSKLWSELHLFELLRLLFERKQIAQFVVNTRVPRKTMELLEATRLPWAQRRAPSLTCLTVRIVNRRNSPLTRKYVEVSFRCWSDLDNEFRGGGEQALSYEDWHGRDAIRGPQLKSPMGPIFTG